MPILGRVINVGEIVPTQVKRNKSQRQAADFTFSTINTAQYLLVSDNHLGQCYQFVKDMLLYEIITELHC